MVKVARKKPSMKTYLDLTLLPCPDINLYFLWSKLYQQIHLALVSNKTNTNGSNVGVAFPQYRYEKGEVSQLGKKLRLIANHEESLRQIDILKWLHRLTDYIHATSIKPVPDSVDQYVCYSRARVKTNKEHLARRKAKRQGIKLEKALDYYNSFEERHSDLPYVQIRSQNTGQQFRLLIEEIPAKTAEQCGEFSCYGLSRNNPVPKFT